MLLRRILVLGDIHAEHTRLRGAIRAFGPQVDAIVSVGDIVDGHGDAAACIRLLRKHHAIVVRGNHDRWFSTRQMRTLPITTLEHNVPPDDRAWLEALPSTRIVPTVMGPMLVAHGYGDEDMTVIREDTHDATIRAHAVWRWIAREDVVIHLAGHTHQPMVRWVASEDHVDGGLWLVNAGTLCERDSPCVLVLDLVSDPATATFYPVAADGSVGTARVVALSAE